MVASGKSTIVNDPWAIPRTGAGTKAPPEAPTYDENSYEPEDTEDGSSTQWRSSPSEFDREPQVREPGAGQNAGNLWAKTMQMSPRTTEVVVATKHASTKVADLTHRPSPRAGGRMPGARGAAPEGGRRAAGVRYWEEGLLERKACAGESTDHRCVSGKSSEIREGRACQRG